MKTLFALWAVLTLGNATAQKNSLTVVVKNIKDATGNVAVALYNSEKSFMKTRLDGKIIRARPGEVTVVFDNVLPGEYAISALHDENQNNKMDSNIIGIPKEGFGFSNNVMGKFGPPTYDKAKFTFSPSEPVQVSLKYM